MIYFPKEGQKYKIGLNIKWRPDIGFLKFSLFLPLPIIIFGNYIDTLTHFKFWGMRILYLKLSYLRAFKNEDILSFASYFKPIGKQRITEVLDSYYKNFMCDKISFPKL